VLANYYVLQTKNDGEKCYQCKEKLYKLAIERQYSVEFTNKLLNFVIDLMKLPPLLEEKF
jgi:PP-loop superfamily ATP-utilizing enzyme